MRFRFLALTLVPLALAACGGGDDAASVQPASTTATRSATQKQAQAAASKQQPGGAGTIAAPGYLAPAVKLKTPSGKVPAVVLLPDTGNRAGAAAEGKKLAQLGIASIVVPSPANVPDQAEAFNKAVAQAQVAIALLGKRHNVDRNRIGLIGEGVGAHVGAVAIGRNPRAVAAAVLADIGGVVVPSPKFAPERWLKRAGGIQLLFQRDLARRAMTDAEVRRLVIASPPGTLMEQYEKLGDQAQAARDDWMKIKLLSI
jgi:pimeloyl-ACP methyl ester carboxylesterase